jgi:FAD/FMN-containing dehydrogenase
LPRVRQFAVPLDVVPTSPPELPNGLSMLPQGLARSYGDSCINADNAILLTERLKCFIEWNRSTGMLRAESGTTLGDILQLVAPQGWFLPVSPGTQFVTLGGAVANDIHGKNHHRAGSFGRYVTQFELLRSSGERLQCSRESHAELFRATIGGLGLTGLITWVEIQLKPIASLGMQVETIPFSTLDECLEINAASERDFEYTVAWIDSLDSNGRGHYIRGNHAADSRERPTPSLDGIAVPFECPNALLNAWTVKAFNTFYYRRVPLRGRQALVHYQPFFYPLDRVHHWNRLYGRRGFYQYQCVVPATDNALAMKEILRTVAGSNQGSCLTVLKMFGNHAPEGLLSFPRAGATLAVDIPNVGNRTRDLLDRLDELVVDAGGAIYPGKDSRMGRRAFEASFPRWREFAASIDPRFSSSFWRRVTS